MSGLQICQWQMWCILIQDTCIDTCIVCQVSDVGCQLSVASCQLLIDKYLAGGTEMNSSPFDDGDTEDVDVPITNIATSNRSITVG